MASDDVISFVIRGVITSALASPHSVGMSTDALERCWNKVIEDATVLSMVPLWKASNGSLSLMPMLWGT